MPEVNDDQSPDPEIRADHGGWLSGPSASDEVRVIQLRPGDVIVHRDQQVTVERLSWAAGLAVEWRAGTASGVFITGPDETVTRLRKAGT
jgi:hypothetical protein